MRKIVVGRAVEVDDPMGAVDHHRGRRKAVGERPLRDLRRMHREQLLGRRLRVAAPSARSSSADDREIDDIVPGRPEPAIDPPLLRDRLEQVVAAAEGLGGAEKQVAALAQGEVEQGDDLLLRLLLEIDQEVPATDQVDAKERRVLQQVLRREDHPLPQFLPDQAAVVGPLEEATQPFIGNLALDRGGEQAAASDAEAVLAAVGREDLDVEAFLRRFRLLGDQHRDRVGLLAGRTGRNPHPDHVAALALAHQRHDDLVGQGLPGLRVAEEAGDGDRQVFDQRLELLRVAPQEFLILGEVREPVQTDAPVHPTRQRALLVKSEVLTGARLHERQDLIERRDARLAVGSALCAGESSRCRWRA